jgi:hypothetical protein
VYLPIRKGKALLIGIASAISAAIFYFTYHEMTMVWAFIACSVLFTLIAARKYRRDAEIISNAQKERPPEIQLQELPHRVLPDDRDPLRLKVPPPLSD